MLVAKDSYMYEMIRTELIDAIGDVTLSKESAIDAACSAYNRLTTRQKNLLGTEYRKKTHRRHDHPVRFDRLGSGGRCGHR